ncbi:hypothetical protein [Microbacterium sp. P02]|uniref:hypothetical protein n=1 Tax=Microbacterium sp. P02 TaxID=3366260 RepID=UPI00366CCC2F
MAVGYRAVLRLDGSEDAIAVAETQLHGWFLEKKNRPGTGFDVADWDGPGIHRLGRGAELSVIHASEALDGSRRRLYRYRETNQHGVWVISVYAFSTPQSRGHSQSLVVDAGHEGSSEFEAINRVDPPRLMRRLLETTEARDGSTALFGEPRVARAEDLDAVLAAIVDPLRTASVIVAASPGRAHEDSWRAIVTSLTKQSVGVATTYLVDEAATTELMERMPRSHHVEPGVIRTFAPLVDLAAPEDGLRHRMLGPATLARSIDGTRVALPLAKRHAESTRRRFIDRDLPPDVRRGLEILTRAEVGSDRTEEVRRRLATPAPGLQLVSPSAASSQTLPEVDSRLTRRLESLVSRWLGLNDATEASLEALESLLVTQSTELSVATEQIDHAIAEVEVRDTELRLSRTAVEDLALDLTIADEAARQLEREVHILRQRLILADRAEETLVEPLESIWAPPDDIAELVARLTPGKGAHISTSRIVFTGDVEVALEVDEHEKTPRYAWAFWDYIHVLFDFAEGRANGQIASGVHGYLKSDAVAGHKCAPDRHAATESESVLNKPEWRRQRVLPVPVEVDPSGFALMDAHFKPTWRDTFAPRMHYYDDTARTGKIYIGYIGRHLKNTKS